MFAAGLVTDNVTPKGVHPSVSLASNTTCEKVANDIFNNMSTSIVLKSDLLSKGYKSGE